MAIAVNIPNEPSISSLDALWTLIKNQKKTVQIALAKRLNASIEEDRKAKVKLSEEEFYAKLDASIESAMAGNVIAMKEGESANQFIDRLLCTK